jgi:hypothetical protein
MRVCTNSRFGNAHCTKDSQGYSRLRSPSAAAIFLRRNSPGQRIPDPTVRRMRGVFRFEPVPALAGTVGAIKTLRDDDFKVHAAAARNSSWPMSPCSYSAMKMPSTRRLSSRVRLALAQRERLRAVILTVAGEHIEGIELRPLVVPA